MHRLPSWIGSSFNVAPLTAAPRDSEKDCELTVNFATSVATTTIKKKVHFADDCGKALESIHEISDQPPCTSQRFRESLDEVYVDKHGVLSAFLNVTRLEPGRTLHVRYTENDWRTYKTVAARRVDPTCGVQNTEKSRSGISAGETAEDSSSSGISIHSSSGISSNDDVLRYLFQFPVGKRNCIELVVVSTLDGTIDNWHDKSYKLRNPRCKVETVTSGCCSIKCW